MQIEGEKSEKQPDISLESETGTRLQKVLYGKLKSMQTSGSCYSSQMFLLYLLLCKEKKNEFIPLTCVFNIYKLYTFFSLPID